MEKSSTELLPIIFNFGIFVYFVGQSHFHPPTPKLLHTLYL